MVPGEERGQATEGGTLLRVPRGALPQPALQLLVLQPQVQTSDHLCHAVRVGSGSDGVALQHLRGHVPTAGVLREAIGTPYRHGQAKVDDGGSEATVLAWLHTDVGRLDVSVYPSPQVEVAQRPGHLPHNRCPLGPCRLALEQVLVQGRPSILCDDGQVIRADKLQSLHPRMALHRGQGLYLAPQGGHGQGILCYGLDNPVTSSHTGQECGAEGALTQSLGPVLHQ